MFLDPKGKKTQESHKREQGAIPELKPGWGEAVGLWKRRRAQKGE